jgi:hypothetical protein
MKAALRGTDWLLPSDSVAVLSDDALLLERIQQAYATRDRLCGPRDPSVNHPAGFQT